jgi:hypothetical protein
MTFTIMFTVSNKALNALASLSSDVFSFLFAKVWTSSVNLLIYLPIYP